MSLNKPSNRRRISGFRWDSPLDLCSKCRGKSKRTMQKYRFQGFGFHLTWETRKECRAQLLSKPHRTLIVCGGSQESQVFPWGQIDNDSKRFPNTDWGRKKWMEASYLGPHVQILLTTAVLATQILSSLTAFTLAFSSTQNIPSVFPWLATAGHSPLHKFSPSFSHPPPYQSISAPSQCLPPHILTFYLSVCQWFVFPVVVTV